MIALETLAAVVARHASLRGDAVCVLDEDRPPLTYERLWSQVCRVRERMRELGVGARHRVGVTLPFGPEAVVALVAAVCCASWVPVSFAGCDEQPPLADVDVVMGPALPGAACLRVRRPSWGPAGGFEVAGCDRVPPVVPSARSLEATLVASARELALALNLGTADRCLVLGSLSDAHTVVSLLAALLSGGAVACRGTGAEATWVSAVGDVDASGRVCRAAPAMSGVEAYSTWVAGGLVSCASAACRSGSVGRPSRVPVRIVDGVGTVLPERYSGRIEVQVEGEWLGTGHLGYTDEEGYLYVLGGRS